MELTRKPKGAFNILVLTVVLVLLSSACSAFSLRKSHFSRGRNVLSPVIFVPGDGGSQIDATLDKPAVVHYICQKKTKNWFNLWLNLELLVPLVIDCWTDNARLIYDNVTRTTSNSPGVQTRVPGFGDSETVEWIDPSHASPGGYFKDIGNALVALGYQRNRTIRGAPYDFRKAPNENDQWFTDFKELIEDTYEINDEVPVTLIVHSMGGPMTMIFLQSMTKAWKGKYVARVISLAGAWAGSMKAVKVFAMGDDLGSFALNGKTMRAQQISSPSLAWLMPSPLFWKGDEVLVRTTSRAYTLDQMEEFFMDLNYPIGWEMVKDTDQYRHNFTAPDVELHCLYGTGIATVQRLNYEKSSGLDGTPKLETGDGDGTVNYRSLAACKEWASLQKEPVRAVELPNVDHMAVLSHSQVLKYILDLMV